MYLSWKQLVQSSSNFVTQSVGKSQEFSFKVILCLYRVKSENLVSSEYYKVIDRREKREAAIITDPRVTFKNIATLL